MIYRCGILAKRNIFCLTVRTNRTILVLYTIVDCDIELTAPFNVLYLRTRLKVDILRRDTDYALRAMVYLAGHYGNGPVSARELAQNGGIPYQLACKLLQKLHNGKLAESSMGPKGGFKLIGEPSRISVLKVIKAIQGRLSLNRCLLSADACSYQRRCRISKKLGELQQQMESFLDSVTLDNLVRSTRAKKGSYKR